MLNKPALSDLMEHVDSKYGLVIMVAKRARSVVDHNPNVVSTGRFNAVSMAMREVADGKLHWKQAGEAADEANEAEADTVAAPAEDAAEAAPEAAVDAPEAETIEAVEAAGQQESEAE